MATCSARRPVNQIPRGYMVLDIGPRTVKEYAAALGRAKAAMENLKRAVAAAERVLANTDKTLVGPDAPATQELREALQEVSRAARAVRVFVEYMDKHPEALISGKAKEKP